MSSDLSRPVRQPAQSAVIPASVERKKTYRRWHAWMGVLSAVFMATVAITAILLQAPASWNLGNITVPSRWFPGYQVLGGNRVLTQVKCAITLADGTAYVGTRKGLFVIHNGRTEEVLQMHGKDIFNMDSRDGRLLVGTREDAWLREADGRWQPVMNMRGAITFAEDGRIIFNRGAEGLHISADLGRTWEPMANLNDAMRQAPYSGDVTLSQLALDLHTGLALFGSTGEYIYVYAISVVLVALALSGFFIRPTYLRWRRRDNAAPVPTRRAS